MNTQVSLYIVNLTPDTRHCTSVVYTCLSKIGCDDVVGPEGMEKFCEDIGVEPENVSFFFTFFAYSARKVLFFLSLIEFGSLMNLFFQN